MNYITKSLSALDKFILTATDADKDRIWSEVKDMNFEGPTISEYFDNAFSMTTYKFIFQEGIVFFGDSKPPEKSFNIINEASKFSLEPFFL